MRQHPAEAEGRSFSEELAAQQGVTTSRSPNRLWSSDQAASIRSPHQAWSSHSLQSGHKTLPLISRCVS
jgi:hypothetical protein